MAEVDPNRVSLRLGAKPLFDAFTFSGRSTISEVVSFYLLYMAVVLGYVLLHSALPYEWLESLAGKVARGLLDLIFTFPYLALLTRRLRDQEATLRWLWLVPMLYAATITMMLLPEGEHSSFSVKLLGMTRRPEWSPVMVVALVASIASFLPLLILLLTPGTQGSNRNGPDPRLAPESSAI